MIQSLYSPCYYQEFVIWDDWTIMGWHVQFWTRLTWCGRSPVLYFEISFLRMKFLHVFLHCGFVPYPRIVILEQHPTKYCFIRSLYLVISHFFAFKIQKKHLLVRRNMFFLCFLACLRISEVSTQCLHGFSNFHATAFLGRQYSTLATRCGAEAPKLQLSKDIMCFLWWRSGSITKRGKHWNTEFGVWMTILSLCDWFTSDVSIFWRCGLDERRVSSENWWPTGFGHMGFPTKRYAMLSLILIETIWSLGPKFHE